MFLPVIITVLSFSLYNVPGLATISQVLALEDYNCGGRSKGAYLTVSDCPYPADVCVLKKEQATTLNIVFAPTKDITKLTVSVSATIVVGGNKYSIDMPNSSNVCADVSPRKTCPLARGQNYIYQAALTPPKTLPLNTALWMVVELKNEDKQNVVCLGAAIEIRG